MNTKDIIKELIQRLYGESIRSGFNFHVSPYDTAGNNYLAAEDDTFLGTLSSIYDSKSIFNSYGPYGSHYSATSIFNAYGKYGSRYSPESAVNRFATIPPKIFINNEYFGKLTANRYLPDAKPVDVFLFYVLHQMGLLDQKMDDLIALVSSM